ncbi:hypothetical protein BDB01DRAFT_790018 [Pilobolus umbonatus]|nr:hypothetical protein BDB01DRAFT_790018 [Pilobolus umbonatus]
MPVFIRRNSNNLPHNDHLLFFLWIFSHYTTLYSIDTVIYRLTISSFPERADKIPYSLFLKTGVVFIRLYIQLLN